MPYFKTPNNTLHFLSLEDIKNGGESYIPHDAVQISDEEYQSLTYVIPDTTKEREAILTQTKEFRELVLNRISGIALAAQIDGNTTITAAFILARQSLLDITKNLPPDNGVLKTELQSRYYDIVQSLYTTAPELVSAFAELDK